MRIFVTGATGFLGSYVAEDLVAHGHDVGVLLRPGTRPWRLASILDRLTVIEGALEDMTALGNGFRSFAPNAVMHMAWRGVGSSERNSPDQARNIIDAVAL